MSAAFDTVDHETLLHRLRESFGLNGAVLRWFSSFVSGRTQFVRCNASKSTPTLVICGGPQGAILSPILFLLYTAELLRIVERHNLRPHMYADDMQIYGFCSPTKTASLKEQISNCIDEVSIWLRSNRLQLNTAKTEVLWCASSRRLHHIPQTPLRVGTDAVFPVAVVRNLGIYMDADASMTTHITKTVSSCFGVLRQIRGIRHSVTRPVAESLVVALVLTRLDYGNALLVGLPQQQLAKLQSVLHAAARLINGARKFDHITPMLLDLHWLPISRRIEFKLAVLAFRCLRGLAPSYLSGELQRVADLESRRRLRSASTAELIIPRARLITVGDRAFHVAAPRIWNSLPPHIVSSTSLAVFKRQLKTHYFSLSYQL